ncbi:unnamed protein product [Pieris brassicae]|uniref:Uncharacterized protein n=1 Tax=Pieris brassicae TaxID=7116 RepID=A0A9P0TB42_PIEBR|nr:unnamed protein product [Pieris brassicae]
MQDCFIRLTDEPESIRNLIGISETFVWSITNGKDLFMALDVTSNTVGVSLELELVVVLCCVLLYTVESGSPNFAAEA